MLMLSSQLNNAEQAKHEHTVSLTITLSTSSKNFLPARKTFYQLEKLSTSSKNFLPAQKIFYQLEKSSTRFHLKNLFRSLGKKLSDKGFCLAIRKTQKSLKQNKKHK